MHDLGEEETSAGWRDRALWASGWHVCRSYQLGKHRPCGCERRGASYPPWRGPSSYTVDAHRAPTGLREWEGRVRPGETACPPPPMGLGQAHLLPPAGPGRGSSRFARSLHLLWVLPSPCSTPPSTATRAGTRWRGLSFHTLPSGKWFLVRTGGRHVVGLKFMGSGPDHWGSHSALPLTTSPLCASVSSSGKWDGASSIPCRGLGRLRELVHPKHSACNLTYGGIIIDEY